MNRIGAPWQVNSVSGYLHDRQDNNSLINKQLLTLLSPCAGISSRYMYKVLRSLSPAFVYIFYFCIQILLRTSTSVFRSPNKCETGCINSRNQFRFQFANLFRFPPNQKLIPSPAFKSRIFLCTALRVYFFILQIQISLIFAIIRSI